jgi:hypothetical protein
LAQEAVGLDVAAERVIGAADAHGLSFFRL